MGEGLVGKRDAILWNPNGKLGLMPEMLSSLGHEEWNTHGYMSYYLHESLRWTEGESSGIEVELQFNWNEECVQWFFEFV